MTAELLRERTFSTLEAGLTQALARQSYRIVRTDPTAPPRRL